MKMICLMTRLALKVFISFNLVLSLCPSKSLSNICSVNSCSFFHSFRIGISYKARKNPALQDSPPAAGQQSCHFPLRRSAILPGGLFYIIGKFGELSYDIKKHPRNFFRRCLFLHIKYRKTELRPAAQLFFTLQLRTT